MPCAPESRINPESLTGLGTPSVRVLRRVAILLTLTLSFVISGRSPCHETSAPSSSDGYIEAASPRCALRFGVGIVPLHELEELGGFAHDVVVLLGEPPSAATHLRQAFRRGREQLAQAAHQRVDG